MHAIWRSVLMPLTIPYAIAIRLRNRRYDRGIGVCRAAVPVVSVGNITTGGTGKTPLVILLARKLMGMRLRPAILTRGYGARAGETPDEVMEFRTALPTVPVVINPDRVAGAEAAVREHSVDCLLLDDGYQHRRLARDLDIVVVDAMNPWGFEKLLPAGRLREPLSSLARADLFIVSRANLADAADVLALDRRLAALDENKPVLRFETRAGEVVHFDGGVEDAGSLSVRCVLPVCGIGNPESFLRLLALHAGGLCKPSVFRDHHRYTRGDAQRIAKAARAEGADLVLTTRKDWGKLAPLWRSMRPDAPPLARLDLRLALEDPDGVLDERLARVVGDDR